MAIVVLLDPHIEILFRSQITYEEVLSWQGFSFEQSHVLKTNPIKTIWSLTYEYDNGIYGMEEAERTINQALQNERKYDSR